KAVIHSVDDPDLGKDDLGERAAVALAGLGSAAEPAVRILSRMLRHPDNRVAAHAALTLTAMAKVASPASRLAALPLIGALRHADRRVRGAAACALGYVGPVPGAVAALTAALHDPDLYVAGEAFFALELFAYAHAAARAILPALGGIVCLAQRSISQHTLRRITWLAGAVIRRAYHRPPSAS